MSKYTDFYPSKVGSSFPYTGSAFITGSLAVTGSGNFEYSVVSYAWSSGDILNTSRQQLAGAGTQAAAVAFGGVTNLASTARTGATEEYSSEAWSNHGPMAIARRQLGGTGTQAAALAFGGGASSLTNATEQYSSEVWSPAAGMGSTRTALAGAGTQVATLAFGGHTNPAATTATEQYNSGTWSPATSLTTARREIMGAGTQTAALAFGGQSPIAGVTEEYSGGSWTTAPSNMITPRISSGAAGTQAAALAFGGNDPAILSVAEEYNSGVWSNAPANLSTSRTFLAGAGSQTAALAIGGRTVPSVTNITEEFGASGAPTPTNGFNFDSVTGDTTVLALVQTSAAKHKTNIEPLGSQMSKIGALRPVRYNWKNRSTPEEIGFIAEEVQKIYPELVGKDSNGKISGINYAKMVSVLVKSVQEQQNEIDSLNNELDNLIK